MLPRTPAPRSAFRPLLLVLSLLAPLTFVERAAAQQTAPVPAVNLSDRRAVVSLFHNYYGNPTSVPMNWTGNLATGVAGDVSDAYRTLTLQRINYFRSMSGLPGNVVFSAANNAVCQQAALMFAAEHNLSHTPPPTWRWWTPEAATAAGSSNIRTESGPADEGPDAVTAFMADDESNNVFVGHRRWLLYPGQTTMGSGSVPAVDTRNWGASCIWVLGPFSPRPAGIPEFTAWPSPGFVPAPLVFRRWSFSYNNADLTNATVAVTKNGAPVAVNVLPPEYQSNVNGNLSILGDNTLVWDLPGNVVNPMADETYAVTVDNVRVAGQTRRFSYTVTSLDPSAEVQPEPVRAPLAVTPTASLRAQVATASRAAFANGKVVLALSEPLATDTVVNYTVSGTAIGGSDYRALSGSVALPAGATKVKLKVVPLPGGGNGTVTIKLAAGAGYTVDPAAKSAKVTVGD